MVFVNDDREPPFERDLRIYPNNPKNPEQQFVNINMSPNLDSVNYFYFFSLRNQGGSQTGLMMLMKGSKK